MYLHFYFIFLQIPDSKREEYADIAMQIFTKHAPRDIRSSQPECMSCSTFISTWYKTFYIIFIYY